MRSIVLALAFAAPLSAVAATPNTFTTPTRPHAAKPETVYLTFINHTSQDREILVAGEVYKVNYSHATHIYAPVGSTVRVYSQTNSKLHGREVLQVAETDQNTSIVLP